MSATHLHTSTAYDINTNHILTMWAEEDDRVRGIDLAKSEHSYTIKTLAIAFCLGIH